MDNKGSIKLTICFEKQFWVGIFEKTVNFEYSVARHVFGSEPSDPELYDFLLNGADNMQFTTPNNTGDVVFKKKNPKRMKREVMYGLNKQKLITKAHEVIKNNQTENKNLHKHKMSEKNRADALERFLIKQLKKKEKLRGH